MAKASSGRLPSGQEAGGPTGAGAGSRLAFGVGQGLQPPAPTQAQG